MNEILSYAICFFIIILGVRDSVKRSLNGRNVTFTLERVLYYISIFITIFIIALKIDDIIKGITKISTLFLNLNGIYNDICKIALLVGIFFLFQVSFYVISRKVIMPIFRGLNKANSVLIVMLSSIFGIVKGLVAILILFVALIMYNNTIGIYNRIDLFSDNKVYEKLYSEIAKNNSDITDEIVENFLPTSNIIIYYNGVTLDEGVKSTNEIDEMAKELTNGVTRDIDKARLLYSWIGSNVEYDYDRAEKALNGEMVENSGAISAFEDRSGICFDYSCLYVAMARSVDLKVRLLTGTAYDGNQYGPHAWNEVYISDIESWIPIDTTFYLAGDYFNNDDFYEDHITESIAGEW